MARLGTLQHKDCKIDFWKYTYRIYLPNGKVVWGDSYQIITEDIARKKVERVLKIFQAGMDEQKRLFREVLGIK